MFVWVAIITIDGRLTPHNTLSTSHNSFNIIYLRVVACIYMFMHMCVRVHVCIYMCVYNILI